MTTGAESLSPLFSRILALVNRIGAVWAAVIALYVVSGLVSPGMFQVDQVLNILQVSAFLGVVATGQTLALLVGGIDVSVAGVVTMSNIVSTSVMVGRSETMLSGIAICLLIAAMVGLINGSEEKSIANGAFTAHGRQFRRTRSGIPDRPNWH